jgi:prepilin-type N-terminal cleavage/methylation domain-containing protein
MDTIIRKSGYTLLEVMVAMAIFASIALPLVGFSNIALNKNTPDMLLEAFMAGKNLMEKTLLELKSLEVPQETKIGQGHFTLTRRIILEDGMIGIYINVSNKDGKTIVRLARDVYPTK